MTITDIHNLPESLKYEFQKKNKIKGVAATETHEQMLPLNLDTAACALSTTDE
jgi:hypothetical protein